MYGGNEYGAVEYGGERGGLSEFWHKIKDVAKAVYSCKPKVSTVWTKVKKTKGE